VAKRVRQAQKLTGPASPGITDLEALRAVSRQVALGVLRLSEDQFDRLVKSGVLRKPVRHGVHDLVGLVEDRLRLAEDENGGDGGDVSTAEAKRRFWAAKALSQELEAVEAGGHVVPIAEVEALEREVLASLAVTLDGIAPRLATELAGLSDAAVIRRRLLSEIRAARTAAAHALANRGGTYAAPRDDGDDADGAAGDVDGGVG
jgi:phage terminase Nu1 subunit (DNA packaging protein)